MPACSAARSPPGPPPAAHVQAASGRQQGAGEAVAGKLFTKPGSTRHQKAGGCQHLSIHPSVCPSILRSPLRHSVTLARPAPGSQPHSRDFCPQITAQLISTSLRTGGRTEGMNHFLPSFSHPHNKSPRSTSTSFPSAPQQAPRGHLSSSSPACSSQAVPMPLGTQQNPSLKGFGAKNIFDFVIWMLGVLHYTDGEPLGGFSRGRAPSTAPSRPYPAAPRLPAPHPPPALRSQRMLAASSPAKIPLEAPGSSQSQQHQADRCLGRTQHPKSHISGHPKEAGSLGISALAALRNAAPSPY